MNGFDGERRHVNLILLRFVSVPSHHTRAGRVAGTACGDGTARDSARLRTRVGKPYGCPSGRVGGPSLSMLGHTPAKPRLPPRWFIRIFWIIHRRLYRWTGGRLGLWRQKPGGWGVMCLTTIGRRTGRTHAVMIGYLEDGPNLVTMAMNGWGDAEPAWWLNLQAHPEAKVDLADGARQVTGRAVQGEERERLWGRWRQVDKNLDAYAARRSRETAVVVFEPR